MVNNPSVRKKGKTDGLHNLILLAEYAQETICKSESYTPISKSLWELFLSNNSNWYGDTFCN